MLVMLCTWSCEKENTSPGGVAKLNLSTYEVEFQDNGKSSVSLTLTSTRDWTAVCTETWVALSQTEGVASKDVVDMTIYVTRNHGAKREANVYFNNKRITKVLTIVQPGINE